MSERRLAVVQSNYIPWKGYFDLIGLSDEFILLDDVQYTRRDWRNRNRIKTRNGVQWLTIPVDVSGKYQQKIKDTRVAHQRWRQTHWTTIQHSYAQAPYFSAYKDVFEPLYRDGREEFLSEINFKFLTAVCDLLHIGTRLSWSMDYSHREAKTERLIDLCQHVGASRYLCGPTARDYMDEPAFGLARINLEYMDYAGYPEYPQLFPPFDHRVSILDLIFNTGHEAPRYLKSCRAATGVQAGLKARATGTDVAQPFSPTCQV